MRVLHITDAKEISGGVKQLKLLMEGLRAEKLEQKLIAPAGPTAKLIESAKFSVRNISMFQDYDVIAAFKIAQEIKAFKPVIVHAHHPKAHALALIARVFTPFKLVVSRRVTHRIPWYPTSRLKYGSSLINRYICVSGAVGDELLRAGVRSSRIEVIGSSTDFERFRPGQASPSILKDLGIHELPSRPPVLGVIANYSSWKGQDLFLDGLAILKKRLTARPDLIFPLSFLSGRDTQSPQLSAKAEALGLGKQIRFFGWREDVPELLRVCSALVCPSLSGEGSSGAIREAFATGIPVIASDISANRELADQGRGWFFRPSDPRSLAQAVIDFLSASPVEVKSRIEKASSFVKENFSVSHMVSRTHSVYKDLAGSGERPVLSGVEGSRTT